MYEDIKAREKKSFRYFRTSGAKFDKLRVLLGLSLTFKDSRMRKFVPPEERPCHQKNVHATRRNSMPPEGKLAVTLT